MDQIHNRKYLLTFRKKLRNNLTSAETTLWKCLQNKQLEGLKFRRQHSVGNYILDFYCTSERLAIELDGAHHYTKEGLEYDAIRTEYLNSMNIKVIRFENCEVFEDLDGVLEKIKKVFGPPLAPP